MREQDDKPLHDWVRQSLDAYRPDYDPTDWKRIQRILRRRRWWRGGFMAGAGCILLGLLSWLMLYAPGKPSPTAAVSLTKTSPSVVHADVNNTNSRVAHHPITLVNTGRKSALSKPKSAWAIAVQPIERQLLQMPVAVLATTPVKPLPITLSNRIYQLKPVAYSFEETAITKQMLTGNFGADSTSYRILDRNLRQWPNAVIVCDLTTSMYPYTTQLFAWFKKNTRTPATKGMVFFTDCDSLGQPTRAGGPPGRMYSTRERTTTSVLPILLDAARNTIRNNDDAENNVEALLFAQNQFPNAKHLILIADNLSTVKDMYLLTNVKKPVHVVLCGTTGSDTALAFQPDYYAIANRTNGSLHTLEDDLIPSRVSAATTLQVGNRYYRYSSRRKQFKLTPFHHRPRRFLNFIWL